MSTAIPINADAPRRRGGGPKTEAGKRRASMNAVKHGMYSAAVVLPGEPQEQYDALLARYLQRFQPDSPDQEYLVHTLVNAEWRINRLMHIQTTRLAERMQQQKDNTRDPATYAYSVEIHQSETLLTADKYEAHLHRDYDRALRRLLHIEKRRAQIKNQRNELDNPPPETPVGRAQTSETANVLTSAASETAARPAPSAPQAPAAVDFIPVFQTPPPATAQSPHSWENRNTPPLDRPRICSTVSPCTEHGSTI